MLHDDISDLVRVLATGLFAYVWLVALLRVSGKRTLAQLNAFDFIVTVALGSVMASVLLSEPVAWTEGALAMTLLAALQFLAAWAAVRLTWVRSALTSKPTVLLRDGQVLADALRRERVDEDSLCAAVRSSGIGGLEAVAVVVLETNGSLSVIPNSSLGTGSALSGTP